jgi:hypothetical protein
MHNRKIQLIRKQSTCVPLARCRAPLRWYAYARTPPCSIVRTTRVMIRGRKLARNLCPERWRLEATREPGSGGASPHPIWVYPGRGKTHAPPSASVHSRCQRIRVSVVATVATVHDSPAATWNADHGGRRHVHQRLRHRAGLGCSGNTVYTRSATVQCGDGEESCCCAWASRCSPAHPTRGCHSCSVTLTRWTRTVTRSPATALQVTSPVPAARRCQPPAQRTQLITDPDHVLWISLQSC